MNPIDDILVAIFARRDSRGRIESSARARATSTPVPILFRSRLLPLFQKAKQAGLLQQSEQEQNIEQLVQGIQLVQSHLKEELIRVLRHLDAKSIVAIPIKGAFSLLWGQGPAGELHTRDLDILIEEERYEAVRDVLVDEGYKQVVTLDPVSGAFTEASHSLVARSERNGYYAYFPWSKIEPLPQIAPYWKPFVELSRRGIPIFPLVEVAGQPSITISFDVHHSLWPSIRPSRVATEKVVLDGLTILRLALADRVVAHGVQTVGKLMDPSIGPQGWGQLSQVMHAISTASDERLPFACAECADRLGVSRPWSGTLEVLAAMAERVGLKDQRFPPELRRASLATFDMFERRYQLAE